MSAVFKEIQRAVEMWDALTGAVEKLAEDDARGWRRCIFGRVDVTAQARALRASAELDDSGITTWLLLRRFVKELLDESSHTLFELVVRGEEILTDLADWKALWAHLNAGAAHEEVVAFQRRLGLALEAYALGREAQEDVDAWLNSAEDLGMLRRDALLSMDRLELHQFSQGDEQAVDPGYNPEVFEFWNINSVIQAMALQRRPGVTLCLIRDPDQALHSFFAVAIQNGGTLTILTDRDEDLNVHPLRKGMSRRPDRTLQRRANRHWFPYYLLDLEVSEDERRLYATERTSLVRTNARGVSIAKMADLHPGCLIWLALLYDRIRERFFVKNHRAQALSYTGEMVRRPAALMSRDSALVRVHGNAQLQAEALDKDTVAAPGYLAGQLDEYHKPSGHNEWMMTRYLDRVSDTVVDVVGESETLQIATTVSDGLPTTYERDWGFRKPRGAVALKGLEPTTFGSAKDIENDRRWLARLNVVRVVQRLADAEFNERKDEGKKWLRRQILRKRDRIIAACVQRELRLPHAEKGEGPRFQDYLPGMTLSGQVAEANVLNFGEGPGWYAKSTKWWGFRRYFTFGHPHHGPNMAIRGAQLTGSLQYECGHCEDRRASIFFHIDLRSGLDIATLLGIPLSKVPWTLQRACHKDLKPHSTGNSILSRMDPVEFELRNPWSELQRDLSIGVYLCRTCHNRMRKEAGLPRWTKAMMEQACKEGRW